MNVPGRTKLSELEIRRAMSSFKDLFQLCRDEPVLTMRLLNEMARSPEAYPEQFAAIYLLGMLAGILGAHCRGDQQMISLVAEHHKMMQSLRPGDYIGPKRKFGRTGSYPPPENPTVV